MNGQRRSDAFESHRLAANLHSELNPVRTRAAERTAMCSSHTHKNRYLQFLLKLDRIKIMIIKATSPTALKLVMRLSAKAEEM